MKHHKAHILGRITLLAVVIFVAWYATKKPSLLENLAHVSPEEDKSFVFFVASYNNKQFYRKNLDSLFSQNYDKYRVIYVDDASTDGTGDLVARYLDEHNQHHRTTLIRNDTQVGGMANIYNAISSCRNDEIVVKVDGDDWLKHDNVLTLLNKVYDDKNVWLTYGQYEEFPIKRLHFSLKEIPQEDIASCTFRKKGYWLGHLMTFYAGLFKKIDQKDFHFIDGSFYSASWDHAFMWPIAEMARDKIKFIPDVLYVYNTGNPLSSKPKRQNKQMCYYYWLRNQASYDQLNSLPV